MKWQKITSTVLIGTLVLGAMAPSVFADDPVEENARQITGKGKIKFNEGDGTDPEIDPGETLDPEDPGVVIVVPPDEGDDNNEQTGFLRVDFISHLNFLEHSITSQEKTYYAKPTEATDKETGQKRYRGNNVRISDLRTGDKGTGWKLSAKLTKQFTNSTGGTLKGATIQYLNPFVNGEADPGQFPAVESVATLELDKDVPMASAVAGKGWGTYTIEYGRPARDADGKPIESMDPKAPEVIGAAEAMTMHQSVALTVPANIPLSINDDYNAKITWTIANL